MFIYLLRYLHFGITFDIGDLNQCQQFSRYIKVAFDGILFPNLYGTFLGRCSTTVLEKFRFFRTVAEQTTRTFLKLFLNYSKML